MGRGTLPWAALSFCGFDFLWVLFVCLFLMKQALFQPMIFHTFTLLIHSPSPLR